VQPDNRSATLDALIDVHRGWLVIPLQAASFSFEVSLTFFPQSRLSQDLIDFLRLYQLASDLGRGRYLVHGLTLGGMALPELEIVATSRLTVIHLDGMLGANFLNLFRAVDLVPSSDSSSFRLTFTLP